MVFSKLKNVYSNLLTTFKSCSFNTYFIERFIDEQKLYLNQKIDPKFVIENFDDFLSNYGLNLNSKVETRKKLWDNFMLLCFLIELIILIISYFLDPIKDFNYLIYLGDPSLIFQSFRKYFIIFLILLYSFVFNVNYLFNHNSKIEWHEVFKCLDGHLTPESIGFKDKKILVKVLVFAKIVFKFVKIITLLLIIIITIFVLFLFFKRLYFKVVKDILLLLSVVFWIPTSLFVLYYLIGTLITSVFSFKIICFYCFISSRYFTKLLEKLQTEMLLNSKRLQMKVQIIELIKEQNQFSTRILKYNKFWSEFYLLMMIHFLPANLICLQQSLFGDLSIQLRIIFIICYLIGIISIVSTSLIVCLLTKDMKLYGKQLLQLQFAANLSLNVKMRIKVKYLLIFI